MQNVCLIKHVKQNVDDEAVYRNKSY